VVADPWGAANRCGGGPFAFSEGRRSADQALPPRPHDDGGHASTTTTSRENSRAMFAAILNQRRRARAGGRRRHSSSTSRPSRYMDEVAAGARALGALRRASGANRRAHLLRLAESRRTSTGRKPRFGMAEYGPLPCSRDRRSTRCRSSARIHTFRSTARASQGPRTHVGAIDVANDTVEMPEQVAGRSDRR